jgi:hypothetical protein
MYQSAKLTPALLNLSTYRSEAEHRAHALQVLEQMQV